MMNIPQVVADQRKFAKSKPLQSHQARIEILTKLKNVIKDSSDEIESALKKDLGKGSFETYISEIDYVINEIDHISHKLSKWMKPKRVSSSLAFFPAKSFIHSEPFGTILVIAPWNYPFQLLFAPIVGALAAGNTIIAKPSEISGETSKVVAKIVNENFDPRLLKVIEGAVPETTELLEQRFDYIFYTGSGNVGKIILEKAAKNLTPVTLELGGKSPCAVYTDEIDLSAKRIVWGKYFNAGQTCVAPDYVIMPEEKIEEFVLSCKKWIEKFYGENTQQSGDYGRIINENHFERLESYLGECEVLVGGETDKASLYISPTIVRSSIDSKVMQEEIFGPILPIISLNNLDEAIELIIDRDKPLAAYAFLDSVNQKENYIESVSAGGMVINDTIIHLSNEKLPFGGVGQSGMGAYHGKHSFDLFSHRKSVMKRSFSLENNLRYPPYENKLWLIRKILKIFG